MVANTVGSSSRRFCSVSFTTSNSRPEMGTTKEPVAASAARKAPRKSTSVI